MFTSDTVHSAAWRSWYGIFCEQLPNSMSTLSPLPRRCIKLTTIVTPQVPWLLRHVREGSAASARKSETGWIARAQPHGARCMSRRIFADDSIAACYSVFLVVPAACDPQKFLVMVRTSY
jgi:hypothetical protein